MWGMMISDIPLIAWYTLTLVFLEGLLSADNALVLAVMVRHLPRDEQKQALRYGIWGAFGFRLIAVLLSAVLMRFWGFKVGGGLYLIYLALAHFLRPGESSTAETGEAENSAKKRRWGSGFWGTVASVELADIAFSIDSILAAVGMADSLPARFGHNWKLAIVYLGGVLGIITMRYVAGYFIILLERFHGLATAAYYLVAWIGLKLVVGGLHSGGYLPIEIPGWMFWTVMLLIMALALIDRSGASPSDSNATENAGEARLSDAEADDASELVNGETAVRGEISSHRQH